MKKYDEYNYQGMENNEELNAVIVGSDKKKTNTGKKLLITALCCSLLGGALGAGGTVLGLRATGSGTIASDSSTVTLVNGSHSESTAKTSGVSVLNTKSADTSTLLTASEVYANNVNSTVGITTSITGTNYWGYQTQAAASGSGFIISADGYILTNHHVIEDANSITVTLYDGKTYEAELIGSDESNDIAVIKIDADGLTPVVLGSSEALSVGDDVVAIGNPLGELTFSLTRGIVSALDRTITTESATMELIQTDCAINSGNSGGALFNMYGEVIGIVNSKYSSSGMNEASIDNIGFAIPIDNVRGIVESLIKNGYVSKPYIGVSLTDLSEENLSYGLPQGAAIGAVTEGAPAAEAGIQVGDIITAVNGEAIENSSDLIAKVKKCQAGDELTLSVYRKGEELEITVKVDVKKQENETKTSEQQTMEQQGRMGQQGGYGQSEQYGYDFPGFGGMFGY